MYGPLSNRIRKIWTKNGPDFRAVMTGRMPRFMKLQSDAMLPPEYVPVFCFHSVTPAGFERQLQYLRDNGYSTLDSAELTSVLEGDSGEPHRNVVLSFDDATGSLWSIAYPLLKKYGFRAVAFAIPGLVPDDETVYPCLDDVREGGAGIGDVTGRETRQILCTWNELRIMHESGVIDIQSHTQTHCRIHVSPALVDFVHPGFDADRYGNVNLPLAADDDPIRPERELRLGRPVYENASRAGGMPRYFEDPQVSSRLVEYVASHGGPGFFSRGWRRRLKALHDDLVSKGQVRGRYEDAGQLSGSIAFEMEEAKRMLESRLPGKTADAFCYPWFEGSATSDGIAARCGYRTAWYGLDLPGRQAGRTTGIRRIRRVSDEYLRCLPGRNRISVATVWSRKIRRLAGSGTDAG